MVYRERLWKQAKGLEASAPSVVEKTLRPLYSYLILAIAGFVILGTSLYGLNVFMAQNPDTAKSARQIVRDYGYGGVFITTLIAGTIIPLASPALVAYAASFGLEPLPLIAIATAGNTGGVVINYYLARALGMQYVEKRMSSSSFKNLEEWWNKWGTLLLIGFGVIPWLPFDLLSLLCGLFKMKIHWFLLISASTRLVQFTIFVFLGSLFGASHPGS